jgi:hypothetical protein
LEAGLRRTVRVKSGLVGADDLGEGLVEHPFLGVGEVIQEGPRDGGLDRWIHTFEFLHAVLRDRDVKLAPVGGGYGVRWRRWCWMGWMWFWWTSSRG